MFQPTSRTFNQGPADVAQPSVSNFEFINTEGSKPKAPPSARRAARVHVMRRYHNEKRNKNNPTPASRQGETTPQPLILPLRSSPRLLTTPQPAAPFGTTQEQRSIESELSQRIVIPALWRGWCQGCLKLIPPNHRWLVPEASLLGQCTCMHPSIPHGLEPAPQSSFPVDPKLVTLLQFSISGVARAIVPMGLQGETSWFAQALKEPACFHGTLLLGVTFNALLRNFTTMPPECFYHYDEAIKYTSAKIEKADDQLEEGTVAAVACLAAFETVINHNNTSESVHLNGLEKVINLRRSRLLLGLSDYLQKFISWVDTCHAVANITRPRFLSIQMNKTIPLNPTFEQEDVVKNCIEKEWGPEFPLTDIKMYEGMDSSMAILFHRLRQLCALATRYCGMKLDPVHQRQFTEGLLILERQVVTSIWSMSSNNRRQRGEDNSVKACARSWHSSVLTFIHVFLRHTAPSAWRVTVDKVAARVRYSLRILSPTELWVNFPPKLLLWVLVVAGVAAADHPARKWLMVLLSQLRAGQGLANWDEALLILKEYAWVDEFCTEPCKKFFEESTFGIETDERQQQGTAFTEELPPDVLERCTKKCYPLGCVPENEFCDK
ncbi:uncharacterized protein LY89DRAFT_740633 [Mollisia scopiformis]|uniref:Uncharacterized protein n=1 Tax=Mollisia scopiformis TaxID=149040 RepID=A0A132BAZ4_MOLSC|nr:uncharacterized protein LY89DRAFT_740633 [Mollisia scopiformis]KUJ09548.1 hypothetical protein LY89DRAFT_740633 [Mollisia scopiformis]